MPIFTIPLVGAMNARGYAKSIGTSAKDQQFINCLFESAQTAATQSSNLYCMKRGGYTAGVISGGNTLSILQHDTQDFNQIYSANVSGTVHIFAGSVDCGISTPNRLRLSDGAINQVTTLAWIDTSHNGWYLPKDALTTAFTFTGDTHTNTTIDNISSMTGLYVGQAISGTNIAANTRIATINTAGSSITTTIATGGTTAGVTVTREAIAKIISANWPSTTTQIANSIVYLDGIWFIGTQYGRIYNTAINDPSTIPADGFLTVDASGSWISQIVKVGRQIAAASGSNGGQWEWFINSGNASGSPLSRSGITFYGGAIDDAVSYFNGDLYFVNTRPQSLMGVGLYKLVEGGRPEKVSDSIMDQIILNRTLYDVATVEISNKTMLGLFLMNNPATNNLVFDPITNNWQVLTVTDGAISGMWRVYFTANNTDGKLFTWASGNTFTDSGASYTMTIQTQNFYLNDGLPFIIDNINLIADTQSSGSATLSSSADDYQSFGTIGSFDLTQPQKNIAGGGEYDSSVAFKLTDSGSNALRAQALKISWRPKL